MTIRETVLGQFGRGGGADVVTVVAPAGRVREVWRLWLALDDADAVAQDEIFAALERLGAVRRES